MELSDLVKKAIIGLGLFIPALSEMTVPEMAISVHAKTDLEHQSKIGYDEAKKSNNRQTKKDYLAGLLNEMGILYDKVKSQNGRVSVLYDYDDPTDKKKIEDWMNEMSKGTEIDKTIFEKARAIKITYSIDGKPGQNERLPFIVVYTNDLFELTEDDIKSKLDRAKAIADPYYTGLLFGKKIPENVANGNAKAYSLGLYGGYSQLAKIFDGTRKNVSKEQTQDVIRSYQQCYVACQRAKERKEEQLSKFMGEIISEADSAMKKLGYMHEYDADKKNWILKMIK